MKKYNYFAYGSNMCQARLEKRLGKVKNLGYHSLFGFELVFNCGYASSMFANIRPKFYDCVEGVIYQMSETQIKKLDTIEGFYGNNGYNRMMIRVNKQGKPLAKNKITAWTYINFNTFSDEEPPIISSKYMNYLIQGATENDLPFYIIDDFRSIKTVEKGKVIE